ncbi:acyltransferase family protein [Dyella amyloliquefaciens]|uniref:acyltransferase family protein n=1 Tax=Dyella amyloliquefaciens TaxID=1770545 RepID=UPI0013EE6F83|nr:acyltransferase [Dyella amyloliquefaciens]
MKSPQGRLSIATDGAPTPGELGNNYDGLRLAASLMVLISHQFVLLSLPEPSIGGLTLGSIAVAMFFVMSGYLVTESWYHDPHLVRFAMRRFLRIWPALAVATLVVALACAAITSLPLHDYLGRDLRRFVSFNLQLRPIYALPGVFTNASASPALSAVNGSWWTIPVEAKCYAYVAILGALGMRRRLFTLLALVAVAAMYVRTLPGHPMANSFDNLCYFYSAFFFIGVCARQFPLEIRRYRWLLLCAGVTCVVFGVLKQQAQVVAWAAMSPFTLWLGAKSTPGLRSAARFGDLSYGIYLYAYFVQQLTVHVWPATSTYIATTAIAMAGTVLLGWCSWHVVEAPALALKRHLRRWFPDAAP